MQKNISRRSPRKGGFGFHLQIFTINGSQELIISTSNWHQGKLTSSFRLVFNKFFAFFCDLAIPPRMTSLRDRSRNNPFQRSPDLLYETNTFSSKIHLSYDCRFGTNLLLILSSSPHDECRNCFKIKGKMGVLSANAEKSMLRRMASLNVQNLWKKWSQATYLFNFLKQLNLRTRWWFKKILKFQ
jgi:hypothetical protein